MKNLAKFVLLFFVAASVVYLVASEIRSRPATTGPASAATEGSISVAATYKGASQTESKQGSRRSVPEVAAYYFHGTARCPTCLKMEQYAREAIEERWRDESGEGQVQWLAVNYDEPENQHFVKEYALVSSALVVVPNRAAAADKGTWKKLERIWDLVGDEEAFKSYVIGEVTNMLRNDL